MMEATYIPALQASPLQQKLAAQRKLYQSQWCFFTDLDGTYMSPYQPSLEEQRSLSPGALNALVQDKSRVAWIATHQITALLEARAIPIIAVTGRTFASVLADQQHGRLPRFEAIASAVGTEIHFLQEDSRYVCDRTYQQVIESTTGFTRSGVYPVCQSIQRTMQHRYPALKLAFQPQDHVSAEPYKISFTFEGTSWQAKFLEDYLTTFLHDHGYAKIRVVMATECKIAGQKHLYNVDILAVAKDYAVEYLQKIINCQGIVAGDSGNDLSMLLGVADLGVIVGNAKREVRATIRNLPVLKKTRHFVSLTMPDTTSRCQRLLYVEPAAITGPESLLKAARACMLLQRLKKSL